MVRIHTDMMGAADPLLVGRNCSSFIGAMKVAVSNQ